MQIGCEEVKDDYMSSFHRLSMSCIFLTTMARRAGTFDRTVRR